MALDSEDGFISSPARTVHRGTREGGAVCGQTHGGEWARVDAEDAEEAVMDYDLEPCSKCIRDAYTLSLWRKDVHSSLVMENVDTPERWVEKYGF